MKYLLMIAGAGLLILTGCSSLDVSTDFDPDNDFNSYRYYAWYDGEMPEDDALSQNPLIQKRIANSVDKDLGSKGFRLASNGAPDFVVIIHAGTKERMQVNNYNYGGYGYGRYRYGYGWGGAAHTDTQVTYYDEATLIVDIIDYQKKELVWRGTGTGTLSKKERTQEESQEVADEVIMKIMKDFPPSK